MTSGAVRVKVGLEIHVQLGTKTKLFCGCLNRSSADPNTDVCPVCLGLPGALPVLNEGAVRLGYAAAALLGSQPRGRFRFWRKNYFYPDLPKGYQITQHTSSIAEGGRLETDMGAVGIERMNVEEEAAKSVHTPDGSVLLDYNRSGVPLLELVTEPHITSAQQAVELLRALKLRLTYARVSDCDMEKGQLRVDTNVSVSLGGQASQRVEVKNLNSFRSVEEVVRYEAQRQAEELEKGGRGTMHTRRFDEMERVTLPMREKAGSADYRFFREPDLPPFHAPAGMVAEASGSLPQMPEERVERYTGMGVSRQAARVLVSEPALSDYFEAALDGVSDPKGLANWLTTVFTGRMNELVLTVEEVGVTPERLAELLRYVEEGTLSRNLAQTLFTRMADEGVRASELVEAEGLVTVRDEVRLKAVVEEVVAGFPDEVERYRSGKAGLLGFLVGQAMKKMGGKGDPKRLSGLLRERLG